MTKNFYLFRFWFQAILSLSVFISTLFLYAEFEKDSFFRLCIFASFLIIFMHVTFKISSTSFSSLNIFKIIICWMILFLLYYFLENEMKLFNVEAQFIFFVIAAFANLLFIFISHKEYENSTEQVIIYSSSPQLFPKRFKVIEEISSKNIHELIRSLISLNISKVFLNFDDVSNEDIETIKSSIDNSNIDVYIFRVSSDNKNFTNLGFQIITKNSFEVKPISKLLKRFLDFFFAIFLSIILSPLLIIIAILIKLDSPGPALFKQNRNGENGKVFKILKFRSMHVHKSDKIIQAKENDERVTKVGRLLRTLSLDELPQIYNILVGEMSFVGPRPHAISHNQEYSEIIPRYNVRYKAKPGLTGLAQIFGYRGETKDKELMEKRIIKDIEYVETWSLFSDIKIIFLTPFSLFKYKAH